MTYDAADRLQTANAAASWGNADVRLRRHRQPEVEHGRRHCHDIHDRCDNQSRERNRHRWGLDTAAIRRARSLDAQGREESTFDRSDCCSRCPASKTTATTPTAAARSSTATAITHDNLRPRRSPARRASRPASPPAAIPPTTASSATASKNRARIWPGRVTSISAATDGQ